MFRLISSRDSDSQVKSECSHPIRDGSTLYLGFLVGVQGCARPDKIPKSRFSKLLEIALTIVNPSTTDLFLLFVFFQIFYGPIRRTFF